MSAIESHVATLPTVPIRNRIEEVTTRIVPAPGVKLTDAIKACNPQGIEDLEIVGKEALLTLFKKTNHEPSISIVDGILYIKCPVPKDAPMLAFNIEAGVVMGNIRTLVVYDQTMKREWARSVFNDKPLNLEGGGVLRIEPKAGDNHE